MKLVSILLSLPFLFLAGGLLLNRPPLLTSPGPIERLKTYFGTNVAETSTEHAFPELRPLQIQAQLPVAREAVLAAMEDLGWREVNGVDQQVTAVVYSRLFRFRDDVEVTMREANGGTLLSARSSSRVGKGDLAANARHILDLFSAVERRLASP